MILFKQEARKLDFKLRIYGIEEEMEVCLEETF
jgi:hypothetical protein